MVTVDSFAATHEFQGKKGAGRFLTTKGLVFEIRAALSSATPKGVSWRPYVLRSYCSTRLLLAEGQGKIGRDLREAILGHDGGVSARYNVGKVWGEELLREAREAYKRCEPFLSTVKSTVTPSEPDLKRAILAVLLPEDEVAKLDVTKMTTEEVRRVVTERLQGARGALPEPNISTESVGHLGHTGQPNNGSEGNAADPLETVVQLSELRDRLASGWVYVTKLPNGEAIVRRPANGGGGYPP
ncbi:integrase/recombinase, partial [mine drainage metagenome]